MVPSVADSAAAALWSNCVNEQCSCWRWSGMVRSVVTPIAVCRESIHIRKEVLYIHRMPPGMGCSIYHNAAMLFVTHSTVKLLIWCCHSSKALARTMTINLTGMSVFLIWWFHGNKMRPPGQKEEKKEISSAAAHELPLGKWINKYADNKLSCNCYFEIRGGEEQEDK